jgi:hypothetical protein
MQEAGHYYTTYFVSLAAGFDPHTALRNSVFAQMPDEVSALDAKYQGISAATETGPGILVSWANFERDLIQRGLHALTGGSSEQERSRTQKALRSTNPGSMEFGFLVHRFGDTYAHTELDDDKKMYKTGWGHALPTLLGSDPDMLHRRPTLFVEYVKHLYTTLSELAGATRSMSAGHALTANEVADFAQEIAGTKVVHVIKRRGGRMTDYEEFEQRVVDDGASESSQIQRIRNLSREYMRIEMDPYRPEGDGETVSWDRYRQRYAQFLRQPDGKTDIKWVDVVAAVHNVARMVGQQPQRDPHYRNIDFPLRPR